MIWMITSPLRYIISRLPFSLKFFISQVIALFIYFPLARFCKLLNNFNIKTENFPMNQYSGFVALCDENRCTR